MTYQPIQFRLLSALVSVLAEGINAELARAGMEPLPASAFGPVPPGDLAGDTISVSYLGGTREKEALQHRDNTFHYAIGIWAFGGSDQLAQEKAISCEFAVTQILDDPANRYLGGLTGSPLVIGNTQVLDIRENEAGLLWRLAIPIECPVRTTRPEQTR
jgi:hypothetical protein